MRKIYAYRRCPKKDAVKKGANVQTVGEWEGNICHPTELTGVSEDMSVCKEETFGPVTSIYSIDTYEEALEKANDTPYGLAAAIFTNDINKALDFAKKQQCGHASYSCVILMCHIVGSSLEDESHVLFGGNGESGVGRETFHANAP